jgi:hypothetical protein
VQKVGGLQHDLPCLFRKQLTGEADGEGEGLSQRALVAVAQTLEASQLFPHWLP